MSKSLAPTLNQQWFDNSGTPLGGGSITIYYANTTTLATVYSSSAGAAQTNPVALNSSGRITSGDIYLNGNISYDFVVKNFSGTVIESFTAVLPNAASSVYLANGTILQDYIDVLAAPSIYYTANASATIRTLQSRLNDTLSVRDFGATGNGVTDDTTAIQNCINYCFLNNKAVYFPAGTYNVTGLDISNKTNLRLYGVGANSIIKNTNVANDTLVLQGSGQVVENLTFTRSAVATTGRDIGMYGSQKTTIRNCQWTASFTSNYCVAVYGSISDLTIDGCLFQAAQSCISLAISTAVDTVTISNNTFRTISNSAISSSNVSTSTKFKIINNLFDYSMQAAGTANGTVFFRSLTNSIISNNIFEDAQIGSGGNQFALNLEGAGTVSTTLIQNVIISNNVFNNNPKGAIRLYGDSSTYKTTGIQIVDNQFSGNNTSISVLNYCDTVIINNNTSTDTAFLYDTTVGVSNVIWKREKTGVRLSSSGTAAAATGDGTWAQLALNRVDFCEDTALTGGYLQGATNGTGQYICGATGNYSVNALVTLVGSTSGATTVGIRVLVNGATAVANAKAFSSGLNFADIAINSIIKLKKNDVVTVQVQVGTSLKNWQINSHDLTGASSSSCVFSIVMDN